VNSNSKPLIPAPVLITGHANADFDCLAAIVAASKLYDDAVLVFPGSQEANLRNFFIESATYLFNFKDAKEIDYSTVKTLVVVDTRQRERISHVAPALENPDLEIHLYDHHPDSNDDLLLQSSRC
jgi:tRNA nucleotidyltransferase (CCA-adding enzyme)